MASHFIAMQMSHRSTVPATETQFYESRSEGLIGLFGSYWDMDGFNFLNLNEQKTQVIVLGTPDLLDRDLPIAIVFI